MDDKTDAMIKSLLLEDQLSYMEWFNRSRNQSKMDKVTFNTRRKKLLEENFVEQVNGGYRLKVKEENIRYIRLFSKRLNEIEKEISKEMMKKSKNFEKILFPLEFCLYFSQRLTLFLVCHRPYMTKPEVMKVEQMLRFSETIIRTVFNDKEKISRMDAIKFEHYLLSKISLNDRVLKWGH